MNMTFATFGLLALLALDANAAEPVSEERTWQHSYPVSAATPRLLVRNIWGNVAVRTGAAGEIVVTAHERRSAPTQELFELSKSRIRLDVETTGDGVSLIVGDPEQDRARTNTCPHCRLEYQFEIAVPPGAHVDVGTVTNGRVEVTGVLGPVNARNVNGPVAVSGVNDCASIESVNGALDVVFARAPGEDCTLQTINGRITIGLPAGAGLDAILSVAHGSIQSDFEVEPIELPAKLEMQERDDRYSYRIQQPAGVRLGGGGPTFTFASLNGDVRIRKNQ